MMTDREIDAIITEQEAVSPLLSLSSQPEWPVLDPLALHGLAGDVVHTLASTTEADPAGLLFDFLVSTGNLLGPQPRAMVGGSEHPARVNAVLVGETSRARKGTARGCIRKLLSQRQGVHQGPGLGPHWADRERRSCGGHRHRISPSAGQPSHDEKQDYRPDHLRPHALQRLHRGGADGAQPLPPEDRIAPAPTCRTEGLVKSS